MKLQKYAIIIGENPELSRKVQEALFAVGFIPSVKESGFYDNARILDLNVTSPSEMHDGWIRLEASLEFCLKDENVKFLWPSCVIEHAAELDGAREKTNTPIKGHRLVTDEERRNHQMPTDCAVLLNAKANRGFGGNTKYWMPCLGGGWRNIEEADISIPIGYEFKQPWEIPPEGYRLVTDEEREKYAKPEQAKYYHTSKSAWLSPSYSGRWYADDTYAVPIGHTFGPERKEVAVSDLVACYEKVHGCKVKVTKGSEG